MKSLTWLLRTKLKNSIKQFFKSPIKIIYGVLMIAFMVFMLFAGEKGPTKDFNDIRFISTGVFALYALMFFFIAKSGFDRGAAFFKMSDVNLVFVTPHKPQSILIYGICQQLGTALLMGIFLIFQFGWMHLSFGVTLLQMLIIMVCYAGVMFLGQVTSMVIYSLTNNRDKLKLIIKIIFYGMFIAFAGYYVLKAVIADSFSTDYLIQVGTGIPATYFPIVGWLAAIVRGLLEANTVLLLTGIILTVVFTIAIMCCLTFMKHDFFEDVLQTAEVTYAITSAAKEGKIAEASPKKVKLGKTGFQKGIGASAIYYKHLIENRRAKTFLLSPSTIIFAITTIVFAYFMRKAGIIPAIAFGAYMQFFSVSLGRMPRELLKPYIYLIPEPPFRKMLAALKEAIPGYFIEALIIFIPVGLIVNCTVPEIVAAVLVRFTMSLVIIGTNMLTDRVFGASAGKMFTMMFYFAVSIAVLVPGIVLGAILPAIGFVFISKTCTIFLVMSIYQIAASVLIVFANRNMLQCAELN